jgi:hypothetical protein
MNLNAEKAKKQATKQLDRVWKRGDTLDLSEALRRTVRMTNPSFGGQLTNSVAYGDRETRELPPAFDKAMAEAQLTALVQAGLIVSGGTGPDPTFLRPKEDVVFRAPVRSIGTDIVEPGVPAHEVTRWIEDTNGELVPVTVTVPAQPPVRRIDFI